MKPLKYLDWFDTLWNEGIEPNRALLARNSLRNLGHNLLLLSAMAGCTQELKQQVQELKQQVEDMRHDMNKMWERDERD